jgi:hypothetical protein
MILNGKSKKDKKYDEADVLREMKELEKEIDLEVRKCPKCGEYIPPEQFKCPSCGHDVGSLEEKERDAEFEKMLTITMKEPTDENDVEGTESSRSEEGRKAGGIESQDGIGEVTVLGGIDVDGDDSAEQAGGEPAKERPGEEGPSGVGTEETGDVDAPADDELEESDEEDIRERMVEEKKTGRKFGGTARCERNDSRRCDNRDGWQHGIQHL